jgi:hypothetical protein
VQQDDEGGRHRRQQRRDPDPLNADHDHAEGRRCDVAEIGGVADTERVDDIENMRIGDGDERERRRQGAEAMEQWNGGDERRGQRGLDPPIPAFGAEQALEGKQPDEAGGDPARDVHGAEAPRHLLGIAPGSVADVGQKPPPVHVRRSSNRRLRRWPPRERLADASRRRKRASRDAPHAFAGVRRPPRSARGAGRRRPGRCFARSRRPGAAMTRNGPYDAASSTAR